jgi:hypothetical protein
VQCNANYSPVDPDKDEYTAVTEADLSNTYSLCLYFNYEGRRWTASFYHSRLEHGSGLGFDPPGEDYYTRYPLYRPQREALEKKGQDVKDVESFMLLARELGFTVRRRYLKNGKIYKS